ncbi:neurogenic locus notch homolog protein 1-like [Mercenaria mercenaria]|uniref:neurogenic locus notch homolog protein 1-like n=1 Tax=Mercenaria mercenaria TaxID=6596 RepID=UPI00234F15E8|nr:neurogenic locus notch homolog protein 1-like [Mercenaria mercenaria]
MKMRKVVNYILFIQLAARCHLIGAFYNRVQRSLPSQDNSLTCNYFCPVESNMTEWLLPPKFEQPCAPKDIQNTYYTKQGIDHVVIRWTEPVATDENGDFPSVRQVKGGINGGTFLGTVWGQTHSIVYLATDKDGLIDNCHFNFTVIVPSCAKLGVVNNGSYTCTNSTAPGSSCMVTCDEGFRLPRSENATCGYTSVANKFPNWTNIQQCEKVKCGSPKAPDNANITCLNNIYSYNTVCKVLCHQGFLMVGPQYTICQAKGTWSVQSLCTRERPSGTHCSPNLCNGHSCIQNHNDTYTCKCSHGWSGTTCKNPPDYCSENICMNDATCNSHNDSYTCSCRAGYSGYLCQNYPIDGQWSDWSFWSKCSATCGSGFQTRHRACNNPPADTYGKPCHGSHTVIRKCESKTCEACPELVHRNESLAYIECETDQSFGLRTCMITCKNGTIHTPWFTEFSKLKCGFETNYSWVPGMVQAPCIVPVLPNVLRLDTEITYRTLIPNENHLAVKDQVRENIKDTNCLQSTQCNTTITLTSTQIGNDKKTKLDLIFRRYIKHFVRNESYSFDDKGLALEAVGGDKLTEVVNHTGKDKTLRISESKI